ncbi:DUF5134 domain-containing protein [Streptomyces sp. NPDC005955]|uniref:DUF5134 domain-containing protein n=1 Tax=Streptomyces sp. NPDC005955 TaxID=3364738 RepID=UPI0036C527C7
MHTPVPAAWLLIALGALSGGYCLARMLTGTGRQRRTAGGEALMGFGTVVMALPTALVAVPRPAWALCTVVFAAAALGALRYARDSVHQLHHLVGTGAMAYMSVVMATAPAGHGHAGFAPLTVALLGYFAVYVLWTGARLVPAAPPPGGSARPDRATGATEATGAAHRPELARACRLSMALAMCAMLLAV